MICQCMNLTKTLRWAAVLVEVALISNLDQRWFKRKESRLMNKWRRDKLRLMKLKLLKMFTSDFSWRKKEDPNVVSPLKCQFRGLKPVSTLTMRLWRCNLNPTIRMQMWMRVMQFILMRKVLLLLEWKA